MKSLGTITISGMKFHAHHGVMEQERIVGNDFTVSVRLKYPIIKAAESDNIEDALNYAKAYDIIATEMQKPSSLLENVAWRIVNALQAHFFNLEGGEVTVTKVTPPITGEMTGISVSIEF